MEKKKKKMTWRRPTGDARAQLFLKMKKKKSPAQNYFFFHATRRTVPNYTLADDLLRSVPGQDVYNSKPVKKRRRKKGRVVAYACAASLSADTVETWRHTRNPKYTAAADPSKTGADEKGGKAFYTIDKTGLTADKIRCYTAAFLRRLSIQRSCLFRLHKNKTHSRKARAFPNELIIPPSHSLFIRYW